METLVITHNFDLARFKYQFTQKATIKINQLKIKAMTNEAVSKIDWKEVGITAGVTLVTAIIGCTIAVVVAQTLIIPAINKAKEKKADSKDKDAKK